MRTKVLNFYCKSCLISVIKKLAKVSRGSQLEIRCVEGVTGQCCLASDTFGNIMAGTIAGAWGGLVAVGVLGLPAPAVLAHASQIILGLPAKFALGLGA